MDSQMALIKFISDNEATIELGNGELKSASIPLGISLQSGYKVLVSQVSGKYLIINAY